MQLVPPACLPTRSCLCPCPVVAPLLQTIATACLHLGAKIQEGPKSIKDVVRECETVRHAKNKALLGRVHDPVRGERAGGGTGGERRGRGEGETVRHAKNRALLGRVHDPVRGAGRGGGERRGRGDGEKVQPAKNKAQLGKWGVPRWGCAWSKRSSWWPRRCWGGCMTR